MRGFSQPAALRRIRENFDAIEAAKTRFQLVDAFQQFLQDSGEMPYLPCFDHKELNDPFETAWSRLIEKIRCTKPMLEHRHFDVERAKSEVMPFRQKIGIDRIVAALPKEANVA